MRDSRVFKFVTIGIIGFWLVLFVFFPNILVFIVSFLTRDQETLIRLKLTMGNYLSLLDPVYLHVFLNSVTMAGITTAICVVVAFPFSYILSRLPGNYKNVALLMIIIPFWTSALIRTYAIKIILTTNGIVNTVLLKTGVISSPLNMLYTNGAVITGLVYTLLPFMILPLYASMEKLDRRLLEAANDLGAGRLQTLIRVIIPLTMPGLVAGGLLVFLPALGLFYIPDILGGAKTLIIGNLVKNQFLDAQNWPFGSAVSIMLTLIMAVLLLANYRSIKAAGKRGIL